jgi:hypothetical protein
MATHVWSVLCRRVLTDNETNSVSYIDVVEELASHSYPSRLTSLVLATYWIKETENDTIDYRVRLLDPSENQIAVKETPAIPFGPEHNRYRVNLAIAGIEIPAPGHYHFTVERKIGSKWMELSRIPIDFLQVDRAVPSPVA